MKMSQGRKGHTLIEMIAVIAILVAVAAISIPMIRPMMQNREKDAAVDVIRARWSQLQYKAKLNQRSYSFECKQSTGKFRCIAETEDEAALDESDDGAFSAEGELPGEIKFSEAKLGDNAGGSSDGWTKVATFLPDGTAKADAEITIGNGPGSITLKLHGATGVVSSAEVSRR